MNNRSVMLQIFTLWKKNSIVLHSFARKTKVSDYITFFRTLQKTLFRPLLVVVNRNSNKQLSNQKPKTFPSEGGKQMCIWLPLDSLHANKIFLKGYGLTETSPAAMVCPRSNCKPGAVGVMLPNLEGKVIDVQSGELLGPNQDGEVCIRGPIVMKGYLNNVKATAECITPDGWFHSGDTGYYDEEGHFYIVDRLKELIKYKGFQVSPAELEALLHTHPNVLDVAVVGIPDMEAGELPKAFIVPKADVTEAEIVEFVADKVAPHKKLRGGVEFIEEIPKTASGKILKRELRK